MNPSNEQLAAVQAANSELEAALSAFEEQGTSDEVKEWALEVLWKLVKTHQKLFQEFAPFVIESATERALAMMANHILNEARRRDVVAHFDSIIILRGAPVAGEKGASEREYAAAAAADMIWVFRHGPIFFGRP